MATMEQNLSKIDQEIDNLYTKKQVPHLVSADKLNEVGAQNLMIGKKWNEKNTVFLAPGSVGKKQKYFDLRRIALGVTIAYQKIQDSAKIGEDILFVATKSPEVAAFVKEQCNLNNCFYITKRWLGGILTNFKTVKASITKLNKLIEMQETGEIKKYAKKEQAQLIRECNKLEAFIGGIKHMVKPPKLIVVVDSVIENIAVAEAKKINASIIALSNSDANAKGLDYNIPCNTKSKRTVWLILSILFDAIASVKGNPINVVGKKDSEIVCPFSKTSTQKSIIALKSK